jgi:NAD(P)-dependent dehydrogenase (short-subunit alcohol dehydrogenase family)
VSEASAFAERYGPWAIVAGASEGVGRELARKVAANGMNGLLVARREGPLIELAERSRAESGVECILQHRTATRMHSMREGVGRALLVGSGAAHGGGRSATIRREAFGVLQQVLWAEAETLVSTWYVSSSAWIHRRCASLRTRQRAVGYSGPRGGSVWRAPLGRLATGAATQVSRGLAPHARSDGRRPEPERVRRRLSERLARSENGRSTR